MQNFLLERVLAHFRFVDRDAEARPCVGLYDASLAFDGNAIADDV